MLASILGPTNLDKFSEIIRKSKKYIEKQASYIGAVLSHYFSKILVVFDYRGMVRLVGESYRKNGGKLEMLYTKNDQDWAVKPWLKFLKFADIKTEKASWHDVLYDLISRPKVVICAGLSAGVLVELGYMKWNYQEGKGNVKTLIGIKNLLREGRFPPEIEYDLKKIIVYCDTKELDEKLKWIVAR